MRELKLSGLRLILLAIVVITIVQIQIVLDGRFILERRITESTPNDSKSVIVVMCYKRLKETKNLLLSLKESIGIEKYHLVVSQSVGGENHTAEYFQMFEEIKVKEWVKTFHHTEQTGGVKATAGVGSAAASMLNLMHGVLYSLEVVPELENVIILEEDTSLSVDGLEFFGRCQQEMKRNKRIKLANTLFFLNSNHPEYDWRFDKPMRYVSRHNPEFIKLLDPKVIVRTQLKNVLFHTLAFMIRRETIEELRPDFKQIYDWLEQNPNAKIENYHNSSKPDVLKSYCNCWNFDRFIERRFEGATYLAPQWFRTAHNSENGISFVNNSDYSFPTYRGKPVHKKEFKIVDVRSEPSIWKSVKQGIGKILPALTCPDVARCINRGNVCGTIKKPTCSLNFACQPCSGDTKGVLKDCNEEFQSCCEGECTADFPSF